MHDEADEFAKDDHCDINDFESFWRFAKQRLACSKASRPTLN